MATLDSSSIASRRLQDYAERLHTARRERCQITSFAPEAALALDDAYAIAAFGVGLRVKEGERVVGFKVGLTGAPARELLGASEPDYGVLTDAMAIDGDAIDLADLGLLQPRIEIEIAAVLSATSAERQSEPPKR